MFYRALAAGRVNGCVADAARTPLPLAGFLGLLRFPVTDQTTGQARPTGTQLARAPVPPYLHSVTMRNCLKWESDGELFEACDHTTSIRVLRHPSRGEAPRGAVTIASGDPWSTRTDKLDVHLVAGAPNSQTVAVMPKGIVSSTVLAWLTRVAPQP